MWNKSAVFLLIIISKLSATFALKNNSESSHHEGIEVVGLEAEKLAKYLLVVCFILIAAIIKIIYHHLHKLASYLPESCLLLIIGIITGLVIRFGFPNERDTFSLTPDVFFFVYLPPIVLESSFSLYHRNFGDNLGTILIFAVLGTTANFLIIGFCLYGLSITDAMGIPRLGISMKECLLFSSFIVAVDPVAVLAIFEDIGVCKDLYFTVFGESLLNDAVTVVLYDIMVAFLVQTNIDGAQIGLGIARFFTVSLGGLLIGLFVGVLCCLLTRVSYSAKTVEPMIILLMGYLAYILADLFTWSGIISMIGCGLVQAAYAFHNISNKSLVIVKRGTKMIASVSEAVIFMFLGIEVVTEDLVWHTGFILWSLVICLLSRGVVILAVCGIINWFRVDLVKISYTEQFILIYGGLRGAVAFSLAILVENKLFTENGVYKRNLLITATLGIIIFTVMIMGTTMKPLVKLLHIRMAKASKLSITQVRHEQL